MPDRVTAVRSERPLMLSKLPYKVYSDCRWPHTTGVGLVMSEMIKSRPSHLEIIDLRVEGGEGSPLSPLRISRALSRAKAEDGIFWNPGFVPPLQTRIPSLVTVHDLSHLEFYSRWHRYYYGCVFKPLYHRCQAIVCVSDYTRRLFLDWSGVAPGRVHLVLNGGASPAYWENQETLNIPFRYVLYPGNHRSYKNLDRLVAAYFGSSLPNQDVHLVMTGTENPALRDMARRLGDDRYLHFLGLVPQQDLPKLYKGSLAVAFVSLSEGFGLPILEGMASGVPVLTSNVTAMPEVAGEAALLVDPKSTREIAAALDRIVNDADLRAELVGRGHQRAKAFDWQRSAVELWHIADQISRQPAL